MMQIRQTKRDVEQLQYSHSQVDTTMVISSAYQSWTMVAGIVPQKLNDSTIVHPGGDKSNAGATII
jgi:hypothetical protein